MHVVCAMTQGAAWSGAYHALQETGGRFSIRYGTGTVNGTVVTDVLALAEPPIVIPDQGLGLATDHSADFASASCDGIFVRTAAPLHTWISVLLEGIPCRARIMLKIGWCRQAFGCP
jgi:hypothetical protein